MHLLHYVLIITFARPAQKDVQDWKAHISIRSFDSPDSDTSLPLPPHVRSLISSSSHSNRPTTLPSLTSHLCYACHTTLTSRSSRGTALQAKNLTHDQPSPAIPLPVWVSSQLLGTVDAGYANTARRVR